MAHVRLTLEQQRFSQAVKQRDGACVLTGETHTSVLEAAHLVPYARCKNKPYVFHRANGITLRADLHCLFDVNGIWLDVQDEGVLLQAATTEAMDCLKRLAPDLAPNSVVNIPAECIPYLKKRYNGSV